MPLPPLPRPSLRAPKLRTPSLRASLACAAALLLLGLGYLWFRDSSLVAVDRVTVSGVAGPDAARVRAALEAAARDMTTLHVRHDELQTAVEPFNSVRSLEVSADFPHGLRIVVHERSAVAALVAGGDRIAVAGDGTILRDVRTVGLPAVSGPPPTGGERLTDRATLRAVAVLAAAPPALRAKVSRVYAGPRGLTAPLEDGPELYFGDGARLVAKWTAAARVLADESSAGAAYLDVRLPERPAAGGLVDPASQVTTSAVESTGVDAATEAAGATP
ncbi:MAG: cell division protein FtsQ/DivIB [Candidatus Nanopelagicales bacterium]